MLAENHPVSANVIPLTVDFFHLWLPFKFYFVFLHYFITVCLGILYYVWHIKDINHRNVDQKSIVQHYFTSVRPRQKIQEMVWNAGEDVMEREPLCNGSSCNCILWKTLWYFLKLQLKLPCNPRISFLSICPEKMKTLPQKIYGLPCSLQHYLNGYEDTKTTSLYNNE